MEDVDSETESRKDAYSIDRLAYKLGGFGLSDKLIIFKRVEQPGGGPPEIEFLSTSPAQTAVIFAQAELLLNFSYALGPELLSRFRRTALVDIDPALLQFWMNTGQITVHPHDLYFTTGETVGVAGGLIPDCSLPWRRIRPPICLEWWPYADVACSEAFTTVSNWAGYDWLLEDGVLWENTKRVAFLAFKDLPRHTPQPLELALWILDDRERQLMEDHGWRIQNSGEVASTPELYQRYIQRSRGEFSCAKPSCMKWQNAWISDRTLCYLGERKARSRAGYRPERTPCRTDPACFAFRRSTRLSMRSQRSMKTILAIDALRASSPKVISMAGAYSPLCKSGIMTKADLSTMTAASAESRFNLIIIRKHEHFGMRLKSIEVINSFRHPIPVGAAKVTFSNIRTLITAFLRFEQVTQPVGGKFSWRTTSTTMIAQNFYRVIGTFSAPKLIGVARLEL